MIFWEEWEFGIREGGGGDFEKKFKFHKCHPKMNLCRKVHPIRTKGKCSNIEGMVFGKGWV